MKMTKFSLWYLSELNMLEVLFVEITQFSIWSHASLAAVDKSFLLEYATCENNISHAQVPLKGCLIT